VSLVAVLLTLAFGAVVGTISGLFGIGGGVLNVPYLYELFAGAAWTGVSVDPAHQTVLAHGTSLAAVIPTAISGAWVHHRARRVDWSIAIPMALGAVVSAPFGALMARGADPAVLKSVFGAVLLIAGARLALRARQGSGSLSADSFAASAPPSRMRPVLAAFLGMLVGGFATLMGIGGAVLTIPLLIWGLRVEMTHVAGTAIAVAVVAASAGVVSYVRTGMGVVGLPPYSAGYVFLPVVVALVPGAVLMARVGARLNHRLETRRLSLLFALLLGAVGLRLILLNAVAAVAG
jgi:uncharacterized membrane protein YfcA